MSNRPHRRYNPLLDEWLIVAPQRCNRPWSGQTEAAQSSQAADSSKAGPASKNPLQPGGLRAGGAIVTPDYASTYVFTNDFPALVPDELEDEATGGEAADDGLFMRHERVRGTCRVMCYHPRSDLTLATMQIEDITSVISEWQSQMTELGATYDWVQVFENKGAVVGCSNPHPHCQIWAGNFLPNQIQTKNRTQLEYYAKNGSRMLLDYARMELRRGERLVVSNADWVVVVPYWAVWPYETLLLPLFPVARITQLTQPQKLSLAETIKALLIKYDNLFRCSFPYSMGWHGAPTGRQHLNNEQEQLVVFTLQQSHMKHQLCRNAWQLHAVYLPPLLRSSTVKKFMAGYELVCEPQRDLTAEMAAFTLRSLPSTQHYTEQ